MFVKSQPPSDLASLLMGMSTGATTGKNGDVSTENAILKLLEKNPQDLEALGLELGANPDLSLDFEALLGDADISMPENLAENNLQAVATDAKALSSLNGKTTTQSALIDLNNKIISQKMEAPNLNSPLQQILKGPGADSQLVSDKNILQKIENNVQEGTNGEINVHKFSAKSSHIKKNDELSGLKPIEMGKNTEESGENILAFRNSANSKTNAMNIYKKNAQQEESSFIKPQMHTATKENSFQFQSVAQGNEQPVTTSSESFSRSLENKIGEATTRVAVGASNVSTNASQSQVIKQVSDYLLQVATAGKDSAEMTVKHQELGDINVKVSRLDKNGDLTINVHTIRPEAHSLIRDNESVLLKSLSESGVKVSEFKLSGPSLMTSSSEGKMDMNFGKENNSRSFTTENAFGQKHHEQNREGAREDSQRRKELWDMYRERMGA